MAGPIDRNAMATDIITLIVNAPGGYTNLTGLTAEHVRYGIVGREIKSFDFLEENVGVRVDLGDSRVPFHGGGQQNLWQTVTILVAVCGDIPETDKKLAIAVSQEVEKLLYNNKALAGGGRLRDHPLHDPMEGLRGPDKMTYFVFMEFVYQYLGTFGV